MAETQTAPPPDINTDRLFWLIGGAAVVLPGLLHDVLPASATLVAVQDADGRPLGRPREYGVHAPVSAVVGTVDEVLELLRVDLTTAFNAVARRRPGGGHYVIPSLGEASLRKQSEALARRYPFPGGGPARRVPRDLEPGGFDRMFPGDAALPPHREALARRLLEAYAAAARGGGGEVPFGLEAEVDCLVADLTRLKQLTAERRAAGEEARRKLREEAVGAG